MYRPQFPFPRVPSPCEDQPCQFSFDNTNLPALGGSLAAGVATGRIPLRLDKDADFYLRGIRSQGNVSFRLEDPNGNAISDSENAAQVSNFEKPGEYSRTNGAGLVVLEGSQEGLRAPAGGNFLLYLYNSTSGSIALSSVCINLFGVKRYAGKGCA